MQAKEPVMTWSTVHRRGEILRAVAATADARLDGRLPTDVPGVADTFRDELDLVAALQLRWHTRLTGAIDRALLHQPTDLDGAIVGAWVATAEELPGIRAILDVQAERPATPEIGTAMARAEAKEYEMLAAMAGRSSYSDHRAVLAGRALVERARAEAESRRAAAPTLPAAHAGSAGSFLERLRAAVSAA